MIVTEMHFRGWMDNEPASYHEAGHVRVAIRIKADVVIIVTIKNAEEGVSGIDMHGFDLDQHYHVAVAGFLAEARGISNRKVSTEKHDVAMMLHHLKLGLAGTKPEFKIEVPVEGGMIQEAGCNKDDFEWLKNHPLDDKRATEAIAHVATYVNNDGSWADIHHIAATLRANKRFTNGI